jgi:hypothetical protein
MVGSGVEAEARLFVVVVPVFRGGGVAAGHGNGREGGTMAAVPADGEISCAVAFDVIEDDAVVRTDLDFAPVEEVIDPFERGDETIWLVDFESAGDPWEPKETAGVFHGVVLVDRGDVVEAGGGETSPWFRWVVIGKRSRVGCEKLISVVDGDVEVIRVAGTEAELGGGTEQEGGSPPPADVNASGWLAQDRGIGGRPPGRHSGAEAS